MYALTFNMNSELSSSHSYMCTYILQITAQNIIWAESEDGNKGMVTICGGGESINSPRCLVGAVTENNEGGKECWLWSAA